MAALNTVRFPVESAYVFGRGVMVTGLEASMDFNLRGKVQDAQARDPETGARLWMLFGVDMDETYDPDAEQSGFHRSAEVKVRIASETRPVVPPALVAGFGPVVEFENLTLTPWPDTARCKAPEQGKAHVCRTRLAYSMRATGLHAFSGALSMQS